MVWIRARSSSLRFGETRRGDRGAPIRYGAYRVDDLLVWGATARILSQLGAVLAR